MAPAPKHSYDEERALIMGAAVHCVETSSITDFTMSALAKAAGMSVGSVYKHIRTKEDVIVALATQSLQHLMNCFDQVLSLPVPFPVRLIALQLVDRARIDCYSFAAELDALVSSETFLKRASEEWLERLMDLDIALEERVHGALIEAIGNGELALGAEQDTEALAEDIMVSSWSMCVGCAQVARQRAARQLVGKGVEQALPLATNDISVRSLQRLLNTYPWTSPVDDAAIQAASELLVEHNLR